MKRRELLERSIKNSLTSNDVKIRMYETEDEARAKSNNTITGNIDMAGRLNIYHNNALRGILNL